MAAAVELDTDAHIGADDVRAYVRANLSGYQVPKLVEFYAELPRADSGKIFKRRLRDPFWEGAGRSI